MQSNHYKTLNTQSSLRQPLVSSHKEEVELKVHDEEIRKNNNNDDNNNNKGNIRKPLGSISRKDLPPNRMSIVIPVDSIGSRCWCLTFKRKSEHTRALEDNCHCPRCIVFLWQIIEEIRWIINRILLFRPFDWILGCTCPYLLQNNTINSIMNWIGMSTIADVLALTVFFFYEITILMSALNDNGGMKPNNTGTENFRIFSIAMGSVAIDSFAMTWFLAQRNTLWNLFMGLPFERAIIYHRIMARFSVLSATIHMIGLANYWSNEGGYENFKTQSATPPMIAGWIAYISAVCLFLFSLESFRRKMFELFVKMHWILFLLFLYFIMKHDSKIWYDSNFNLFQLSIYFWLLDLSWRVYNIFHTRARLVSLKTLPGNVIEISFEKQGFVYESGQYIFLCIPALDLTEWHPFSIASCPQDDHVVVCVRVLGDWTKKLQVIASKVEHSNEPDKILKDLTIFVEGPYGSPSIPLHYYKHVVYISGGIGITPMQSMFNEMIHEIRDGRQMTRIHFIWVIRDMDMVDQFAAQHWSVIPFRDPTNEVSSQEYKERAMAHASSRLPAFFSPDFFLVQPSTTKAIFEDNRCNIITHFYLTQVKEEKKKELLQKYPFLKFGRPDVKNILAEAKEAFLETDGAGSRISASVYGLAALCCGPPPLVEEVRKYGTEYGFAVHTEVFDF